MTTNCPKHATGGGPCYCEVSLPNTPGALEIHQDIVAEKLDEMADISEYWKRNREKGRNPNAIRSAMLMLAEEILSITSTQAKSSIRIR